MGSVAEQDPPVDAPRAGGDRRGGQPGRPAVVIWALGLFVFASLVRVLGADHGLPHAPEPDTYIVNQADEMVRSGLTDRHRAGWKYPHLVATIVAALPLPAVERPGAGAPLEAHLEAVRWLHVRTRVIAALLSALAVPMTFLIALRFMGLRWAALSGLMVAISLLHLCYSAQARPHGPVSGFVMFGIWLAIRWSERPTVSRAALMGLACAASVGTLHTGFSVLGAVGVAAIVVIRRQSDTTTLRRLGRTAWHLSLVAGLVAMSAAWFYVRADEGHGRQEQPVAKAKAQREGTVGDARVDERLKEWRASVRDKRGKADLKISGHEIPLERFTGDGFGVAWRALSQYDPLLLWLALFGVLALVLIGPSRAPPAFWIVAGFAAPTFLLFGAYDLSYARFYLVLQPATCLCAVAGFRWLAGLPRVGPVLMVAGGGCLAVALVASLQATRLRLRPDTLTQAARWMEENVGRETSVHATASYALPIFGRPEVLDAGSSWSRGPWDTYQWLLLHPKARGFPGRTGEFTERDDEPAERLGFNLHQTTTKEIYQMVTLPERATVASEMLERTSARVAVLPVSEKYNVRPVPFGVIRDAWLDALNRDAEWRRVKTIHNGLHRERPQPGYKLTFFDLFQAQSFGPTVEIYRR